MDRALPSRVALVFGLAIVLASLVFFLFRPALRYDFVMLDDGAYLIQNPAERAGLTVESVRWAFTTVHVHWWLPALWLSFMADVELHGFSPAGFHSTNVLLHALNTALLFWILVRLTGSIWKSAFVAALFAFHPLRVESVAWITARKDVLSGFFFFLCLNTYASVAARPTPARRTLLCALMLIGLSAKAILITLPFVLLLLDIWPLRRIHIETAPWNWHSWKPLLIEKWPLFGLALAFALLNWHTHAPGNGGETGMLLWTRLGLVFPNYLAYLTKIFYPIHLSLLYPECDMVQWPQSIAAALACLGFTGLAFCLRRRHPYLLVGWLWFMITLFPVIRGVRLGLASMADRYTYLPSVGLGIALVWVTDSIRPGRTPLRILFSAIGLLLLAVCAMQTRAYLPLWQNSFTAFGNTLNYFPDHPAANNSFGYSLLELGHPEQALPHLKKAVDGDPASAQFAANLALCLVLLGKPDEALALSISTQNRHPPGLEDLNCAAGLAWLEKNEPAKAIPLLQQAVLAPFAPTAWRIELARAYRDANQMPAFSHELAQVFAGDSNPNHLEAYYADLWKQGHRNRAWTFFQREIDRQPSNATLLNNVAWLLATHPSFLDTLAVALASDGRFEEAWQVARQAIDLADQIPAPALSASLRQHLEFCSAGDKCLCGDQWPGDCECQCANGNLPDASPLIQSRNVSAFLFQPGPVVLEKFQVLPQGG